jgi:negative regulator of flagellin synthesis FlgM
LGEYRTIDLSITQIIGRKTMTDAISNAAANAANALKSAARTSEATNKAKLDTADAVETAATSPKVEPSTVELSPALKAALSNADFDSAKVEAIRTAIEQGNYPLDDTKIAESFVPLEKLL